MNVRLYAIFVLVAILGCRKKEPHISADTQTETHSEIKRKPETPPESHPTTPAETTRHYTASPASSTEPSEFNAAKAMISSLFPGNPAMEIHGLFGTDKKTTIQKIENLRERQGFVDLSRVRVIAVNDSLKIAAFNIFLCDKRVSLDSLLRGPLQENPPRSLSLLQLIYYNARTQKVLGKPADYPLVAQEWTCSGEICDQISVADLKLINSDNAVCVLYFVKNLDSYHTQAFALSRQQTVVSSSQEPYGNLGGSSGCEAEKQIQRFDVTNRGVIMQFTAVCDDSCLDCGDVGLEPGKTSGTKIVLDLEI